MTMARYIDADAFRNTIMCQPKNMGANYVLELVSKAPTADVVERKTGKWINVFIDGLGLNGLEFECSECGKRSAGRTNYCAYCGAEMESE